MADALCGPSNALQNFQKHSSVDRTLQQDRLVSRQSPSHAFRSGPGQNAGVLDPEFEAFQAGHPPQPEALHFPPHAAQNAPLPNFAGPAALPDWASDFQRLHVSSPPPHVAHQQQHFQAQAPRHNHTVSWHQDFLQQQHTSSSVPQASHAPSLSMYSNTPVHGGYGFGAMQQHSPFMAQQDTSAKGKEQEQSNVPMFDDAAFERAFDAAWDEMLETEEAAQAEVPLESRTTRRVGPVRFDDQGVATSDLAESSLNQRPEELLRKLTPQTVEHPAPELYQERYEPTREEAAEQQEQKPTPNDDEELARTAGQLLESVSHDTSKKFQESNFLALMRRLRDHEVRVDGDKMVETNPIPASHQDLDLGRDDTRTMTGALQTDNDDHDIGSATIASEAVRGRVDNEMPGFAL